MIFGYARVSTIEQNLDLQKDALMKEGCQKIYEERLSGAKTDRPILGSMLEVMSEGDILVIWKLDRLGRSLKHLIEIVANLEKKGIGFKSITDNFDTTTASGKLFFHIIGALAEYERSMIRTRVLAGLEAARTRGKVGGRPQSMNKDTLAIAKNLLAVGTPKGDVAELLKVSQSTLYRYLNKSA